MDSKHGLLDSEMTWLPQGKVLTRLAFVRAA